MTADVKEDSHEADSKPQTDGSGESLGAAEEKSRFNAKKIILFVALPLTVVIGGVLAAYFTGHLDGVMGKKPDCATITQEDPEYASCVEELAKAAAAKGPGLFIDVPNMIVNLNSPARQPRFLKISLKIELEKATEQQAFEAIMPRVIDQFQNYLRELRLEDLRGSSGMYRMKIELLNRVRAAAPGIAVRDVLFQEILIQ